MSAVVVTPIMSFPSPIVGCLHGYSFGKFVALDLPNPRHWTSPLQGKPGCRSSTFYIITSATSRMFGVLTCPDGPEKAERRVRPTYMAVYIRQEPCGWTLCLRWSWSLEDFLFWAAFVRR